MIHFLNIAEVAKELKVPVSTINYWRLRGTGPAWCKIGKRVFYDPADLMEWINSTRRKAA